MKDNYVYPRGNAPGMELRDWFAGMAMQGIITRMPQDEYDGCLNCDDDWSCVAGDAYRIADHMINSSERNKTND